MLMISDTFSCVFHFILYGLGGKCCPFSSVTFSKPQCKRKRKRTQETEINFTPVDKYKRQKCMLQTLKGKKENRNLGGLPTVTLFCI